MVDAEVVDTRLFGDQAARAWGGVSFQKLYSIKFVVSAFEDKDGNAYHGEVLHGTETPYGRGGMRFADGRTFDGFYKAGLAEGYGTEMHPDGSRYIGLWKKGERHGAGLWKASGSLDAASYEGTWSANLRCGVGRSVDADGGTYTGQWVEDKKDGRGRYAAAAGGRTREGYWRKDVEHGPGIASDQAGELGNKFHGMWLHGKRIDTMCKMDYATGAVYFGALDTMDGAEAGGKSLSSQTGHGLLVFKNQRVGAHVEGQWKDSFTCDVIGDESELASVLEEMKKAGKLRTAMRSGTDVYSGEWSQAKQQGQGTMMFEDGDMYQGQWHGGKLQGHGTMRYANGDTYDGTFTLGRKDGKGRMLYANGDEYFGDWNSGDREGAGFLKAQGLYYTGDWKADLRCGLGTCQWVNGDHYVGKWGSDEPTGEGIMSYSGGIDTFESHQAASGVPDENADEDAGEYTSSSGEHYAGEWSLGLRSGKGKMYYRQGQIYEGQWLNGEKNGEGYMRELDGCKYQGQWKDDHRSGQGTETISCDVTSYGRNNAAALGGEVYVGQWKGDARDGAGLVKSNTFSYEGQWKRGLVHGHGILHEDCDSLEAEWAEGFQLDGQAQLTFGRLDGRGLYTLAQPTALDMDLANDQAGTGDKVDPFAVRNRETVANTTFGLEGGDKNDNPKMAHLRELCMGKGVVVMHSLTTAKSAAGPDRNTIGEESGDGVTVPFYKGEVVGKPPMRHGAGCMTYRNKDEFEGRWDEDSACQPLGSHRYHTKTDYVAGRHWIPVEGKGTITFEDAGLYDGSWAGGFASGKGRLRYASGAGTAPVAGDGLKVAPAVVRHGGSEYQGQWVLRVTPLFDPQSDLLPHGTDPTTARVSVRAPPAAANGEWLCRQGDGASYDYASGNRYLGKWAEDVQSGKGTMEYGDGGKYTGDWSGGVRAGKGTMTTSGGDCYAGGWVEDCMSGDGSEMKYANGDKHVGSWRVGVRCGKGRLEMSNGNVYEGEWVGDKLVTGTCVTQQGDAFEGQWAPGFLLHGEGTFSRGANPAGAWSSTPVRHDAPDGYLTYQGQWVKGLRQGTGTGTTRDGRIMRGKWEGDALLPGSMIDYTADACKHSNDRTLFTGTAGYADKRLPGPKTTGAHTVTTRSNGAGRMVYPDGSVYEGEWVDEKRSGHGRLVYSNGDTYSGSWLLDKRDGRGTFKWEGPETRQYSCRAGESHHGSFVNGAAVDSDVDILFSNGDRYVGQWLLAGGKAEWTSAMSTELDKNNPRGTRSGHGTMVYVDGRRYEGEWAGDVFHGLGSLRDNGKGNGAVEYTGDFVSGVRHGNGTQAYADGSEYSGCWQQGIRGFNRLFAASLKEGVREYKGEMAGERCAVPLPADARLIPTIRDVAALDTTTAESMLKGTLRMANGSVYAGEWREDVFCGDGTFTWANGDVYVGEWVGGSRVGSGLFSTASDGTCYSVKPAEAAVSSTSQLTPAAAFEKKMLDAGRKPHLDSANLPTAGVTQSKSTTSHITTFTSGIVSSSRAVGVKSGQGSFSSKSGDYKYAGAWSDDVKHGEGMLVETAAEASSVHKGGTAQTYEGKFHNDKVTGDGVFTDADSTYTGQFVDGRRNGSGREEMAGQVITGSWTSDVKQGDGVTELERDIAVFLGEEQEVHNTEFAGTYTDDVTSRLDGHGVMTYEDGSQYDGHWLNTKRHGKGVMKYSNGDVYQGQWGEGYRQGTGLIKFGDGTSFDGQWHLDKQSGRGWHISAAAGSLACSGRWINGKQVGSMMRLDLAKSGLEAREVNDLATAHLELGSNHSTPSGFGMLVFMDGTVYRGDWESGVMNGFGKLVYPDGQQYEGNFVNAGRSGAGKQTFQDGDVYEGEWANDKQNGLGRYINAGEGFEGSDEVFKGRWKDGEVTGVLEPLY